MDFFEPYPNGDLFFKTIYLKKDFTVFAWISSENSLIIQLYKLSYLSGGQLVTQIPDIEIIFNYIDEILSDFVKINDRKLAFICTNSFISFRMTTRRRNLQGFSLLNILNILIIDIQPDYTEFSEPKIYNAIIEDYIPTYQISGFVYNDFLLFTSTAIRIEEYFNLEDEINYLSMFMIFGYPNGTDSIIDISQFLHLDEESIGEITFYDFLKENLTIENNIFDYESADIIKLVSIPDELIIVEKNGSEDGSDLILQNNSEIYFSSNYIILQNATLIKTSKYYYIDYQYIVREQVSRGISSVIPKLFYGRINRIQFKLCHEYCETCYEIGISNQTQNCISCLPEYQYGYFHDYDLEENQIKCIPKDHFYNIDTGNISLCNEDNSKYYIDTNNNKEICFSNSYNCPDSYPRIIDGTRECFSCDYAHYKNDKCSLDDYMNMSCTQCNFYCYKEGLCNFDDLEPNEDFYEKIKSGGFISNYNGESGDLKVSNGIGYSFHITTLENELNDLKDNTRRDYSIIDLKDCAELLKSQNGLNSDDDLVIVKYENDDMVSNGIDKSIQYEVYLPNSNTKLDLSVCADKNIIIYVPIELSEKTQKLYDNLKEQGYNLFDKNDKFYKEFCTPYNSLDGTDVILPDRLNMYEQNKLDCQKNCEYSDYLPESKYLKCECKATNETKIDTKEPKKVTAKSVIKKFYDVLKYSNYKVLYCYNLVFRKVTIKENAGSILSNIYFIGYLIAVGIFCYKKASYLKTEIDKLLSEDNNEIKNLEINKDNISIFNKNNIYDKEKLQQEIKVDEKINKDNKEGINEEKTEKNNENNNKDIKEIKITSSKNETVNIIKYSKRKSDFGYKNNISFLNMFKNNEKNAAKKQKTRDINKLKENASENKMLSSKDVLNNKLPILDQESIKDIDNTPSEKDKNSNKDDKNEIKLLSNYELNDLDYEDALEKDNRNFLNIYWYLLKREHIILFTFFNWNDFNFFSIKLSRLFLSVCSDMAFNVFFFSDESMHKRYENGGGYGFSDQFAQMVYSTIISQLLQIYVNYLTMTDIHYYQLKELKKNYNINSKKALSVIKCIKIKIIAYFASTFLLFLFFWYTCAAFCAVYVNTQGIYVADSYMSFLMGLLYPFALYLVPTALRFLSLKAKKSKKMKILYSLSDKIPFF